MIVYQPVIQTVSINGRPERMLDMDRVDSQLAALISHTNTNASNTDDNAKLTAMCLVELKEFHDFMEFYFSMMPDMRRAFNDWKIAQKTKERILDGHNGSEAGSPV